MKHSYGPVEDFLRSQLGRAQKVADMQLLCCHYAQTVNLSSHTLEINAFPEADYRMRFATGYRNFGVTIELYSLSAYILKVC